MFCNSEKNSFTMINYIPFNVNILTKNSNNNNLNIKDGFNCLLNDEKSFNEQKGIFCGIFCQECQKATVHKESKSFYYTAKNVIIILNRGENCENKTEIDFGEELELLNIKYRLIGIIELKDEGEYISFTRNENNIWRLNGNENNIMPFDALKAIGTVVSLFYYRIDNNMILQSNSSNIQQQLNNLSLSENNTNINPNNSIYNNFNNSHFNGSNNNIYSNSANNSTMNNTNNNANINGMNNMGQPNIYFPPNNMNQFIIQNNNNYNIQGPNITYQMNMNYYNNNIQINNFQRGNSTNYNNNNFNNF